MTDSDTLPGDAPENVGMNAEIIAQKVTSTSLRTSEEHFRILVEGIKDYAIFLLDKEGHVASWNSGAERIKGFRAEEIIGQHISRFYTKEAADSRHPEYELAVATKEGRYEETGIRVRQDGTTFWANVVITALYDKDGALRGFAKVTRDITERRNAEERLRQSEERFRLLVDGSLDYGIFMLDPSGRIISWNRGAERIKGYSSEEILGKHFSIFYTKEDLDRRLPELELEIATREGRFVDDGWRVRKDGSEFWASVVITALYDEKGELRGFGKVSRDLTEWKRTADQAIRDLNRQLEQRVAERTAQLEAANKELEAFSYSVSHDLRAPLRSIDGYSQAVLEDYADSLDEGAKEALGRVRANSQRMGQLIDDLLELSRLGRGHLDRGDVNMSSIVAKVAADLKQRFPGREIELVISPDLKAYVDPRLIRVALENLLANAWKFTAKREQARIEFGVAEEDGKRSYFIRDNGVGFDMEYAGKLFGAFQRLHTMEEFPGTGIGLATVQRVIHRHGGRIWAHGVPGEGATFFFILD